MQADRFVRLKELKSLVGFSEVTIWRKEKEGTFPKRRKVGKRAVAWSYNEVMEYINSQFN
jgi:prophage regulatory protein